MDPSSGQIIKEIPGRIRVYKDGRKERLAGTDTVPAGLDPATGVRSKDIVISPDTSVTVRIYIPKSNETNPKKIPLLIYFHGGAFIIHSAASPVYQNFLNLIASECNIVIVSVDYRRAPEHPLPACYHDAWEAVRWVAQHVSGTGPEPWLNQYPDFRRVFIAGDSAGGNITHHIAIRVGLEHQPGPAGTGGATLAGVYLQGIILLHPFFWGKDRIGSESDNDPKISSINDLWMFIYPGTSGLDDPLCNPDKDPKVANLGCSRVLVFVAEKDILRDRDWNYKDVLVKNGWKGDIEVIEDKGEDHVYFLFYPSSENACNMRKRICTFINKQ